MSAAYPSGNTSANPASMKPSALGGRAHWRSLLPLATTLVVISATFFLLTPPNQVLVNDEWCYVHLAKVFAEKGTVELGGCSIAAAFPMYLPSALLVWALGFSVFAFRITVLLFAMIGAGFLYLLARQLGNSEKRAALATAIVILSPVTIPNMVTYMTDIPGMTLLLGASYFGLKAIQDPSRYRTVNVAAAALMYAAAICTRQVFIIFALAFCMALAAAGRRSRRMLATAAVCSAFVLLTFMGVQYWLVHRPDAVFQGGSLQLTVETLRHFGFLTKSGVKLSATLLVLLLPASLFVAFSQSRRALSNRWSRIIWLGASAALAVTGWAGPFPTLGNMVTQYGFLSPTPFGHRPVVLPRPIGWAISATAIAVAIVASRNVIRQLRRALPDLTASGIFIISNLLATTGYILIIVSRASWFLGDRYLIPSLPFIVLALFQSVQSEQFVPKRDSGHVGVETLDGEATGARQSFRLSLMPRYVFAIVMVALFAGFSALSFRDYIHEAEAKAVVFQRLVASGFSEREIVSGYEQDDWREIEERGSVNYAQVNPAYPMTSAPRIGQGSYHVMHLRPRVALLIELEHAKVSTLVKPACFRSSLGGASICAFGIPLELAESGGLKRTQ